MNERDTERDENSIFRMSIKGFDCGGLTFLFHVKN